MLDIHARAVRHRIEGWQQAGLLDDVTAARLVAHEAARPTTSLPLLTSIGGLSVALGIVALVSANWDNLPIALKLGVHFAFNLGLGGWLGWGAVTGRLSYFGREVAALVLSASTLALIAHVGQSFHLQGKVFSALLFWLVLVTPFTVGLTLSVVNRAVWLCGAAVTLWMGMDEYAHMLADHELVTSVCAALAVAAYAAPLLTHGRGHLALWGRDLRNISLVVLVIVTAGAQFFWQMQTLHGDAAETRDFTIGAVVAAIGFGGVHLALRRRGAVTGGAFGRWMTAFVTLSPLIAIPPVAIKIGSDDFISAIAFSLYFVAIAALAEWSGRVWLYRLAVVLVALRLLAVFAIAFYGLLATGIGLIIAGLMLLATGWVLRRLLSRGSPVKQEATP